MSGFPSPGAATPRRNRFVSFGLAMVVLGWLVLVADLVVSDTQLQAGSLVAVLALKADIATLAQSLVATGLGLAVLGGLREGFGALNRFFDAVLQRSVTQRPTPMPEPESMAVDDDIVVAPRGVDRIVPERPAPSAQGRNYQILPDGSVEVETLLGTRVFASMDEARDFIR